MSAPSVTPRLLLAGLLLAACQRPAAEADPAERFLRLMPPPQQGAETEVASGQKEEENRFERERWIEERHRAADGVDWRAIERDNARAAAERKRLGQRSPAATAGAWTEVGSRNQAGNTQIVRRTADALTLYLGSALGGVFKGTAAGNDWTAISDHVYGGVSHLQLVPTGGTPVIVRAAGGTVLRSADDGATWQTPAGLSGIEATRRLLMLDDAQHTLLLLARRNGWRLYRSTDAGANWTEVRDVSGSTPDIWTPRDQLGPVYLMDSNRLWESTDGGLSFTTHGVPAPINADRVLLGGHEAGGVGQVFSVAVDPAGGGDWQLWRTEDAGQTWSHPSDLPGMWEAFATSTQSIKLIAYGGVDMHYSRDAGQSFQAINSWAEYYGDPAGKLHADIMGITVIPDASAAKGERWYVNTHGGTYQSLDRLRTVENLSLATLGVSQYYSTLTSRRDPDVLAVGSQDQGYQWGVTPAPPGTPGPYADLAQLISGDYGHLSSSDGSHDLVYSDYPGFVLIQEGETNPSLHTADFPGGFAGQWLPFMTADPTNKKSFYLLGRTIWRYTRSGPRSWSPVQHTTHDFQGTLSCLEFSPLDPSRAWACTTDGRLFWSTDGAVTWTQSQDTVPGSHYFYGTTLVASERNPDEVWACGSGYSTVAVRYSNDGGLTWKNRSQNLPRTLAYCMAEAPDGSGRMYLGTETGAWEWDPVAREWNDILGTDGPITLYWSVETVPSRNLIRFGTYGRGVWDYAPGTPGCFPYGELRGEPNHLRLTADGPPRIGQPITFSVSGAPVGATGFLAICTDPAEVADLGGTLFVDLNTRTHQYSFLTDANGVGTVVLPLPTNASLVGQERFLQAAVLDAAQPDGWALSHGLRALVGQ